MRPSRGFQDIKMPPGNTARRREAGVSHRLQWTANGAAGILPRPAYRNGRLPWRRTQNQRLPRIRDSAGSANPCAVPVCKILPSVNFFVSQFLLPALVARQRICPADRPQSLPARCQVLRCSPGFGTLVPPNRPVGRSTGCRRTDWASIPPSLLSLGSQTRR